MTGGIELVDAAAIKSLATGNEVSVVGFGSLLSGIWWLWVPGGLWVSM